MNPNCIIQSQVERREAIITSLPSHCTDCIKPASVTEQSRLSFRWSRLGMKVVILVVVVGVSDLIDYLIFAIRNVL